MDINEIPTMNDFNFIDLDDKIIPISEAAQVRPQGERIKIGFPVLDEAMAGGLKNGDLMIISGKSGEGKTTLAQTLTYQFCKQAMPCLWFSYEVSLSHLNNKFQEMGIGEHYTAYTPKKNTTGELEWIKAKIKEGKIKHATKIIFIDHIDFLTPTNLKSSDNQSIALKNIATELKSLAIELDVIIVLMAHLKKLSSDKEPDMEDIGYSAGIFQLADYVIFTIREKLGQARSLAKQQNYGDTYTNNSIIKFVKNRETGQLKFIKCVYSRGRFVELDQFAEEPLRDVKIFGERG